MALSAMMHWLLGQAIGAIELVRSIPGGTIPGLHGYEGSQYLVWHYYGLKPQENSC
jgi:hypothetical protein